MKTENRRRIWQTVNGNVLLMRVLYKNEIIVKITDTVTGLNKRPNV